MLNTGIVTEEWTNLVTATCSQSLPKFSPTHAQVQTATSALWCDVAFVWQDVMTVVGFLLQQFNAVTNPVLY
jgi:hypothetical protein